MFKVQEKQYKFMDRQVPVTYKWLCSVNASFEKPVPGCECDTECILFGDCCVDAFEKSLEITDKENLIDALKEPETLYTRSNPLSFESFYLSLYHNYSNCYELNVNNSEVAISVIDKCPETNSTELETIFQRKCHNVSACFLSSIPATLLLSKNWQVVFRNVYCARCHGLDNDDIVLWEAYEKCPDGFNLTGIKHPEDIRFTGCTGVYMPPTNTGNLRQCFREQDLISGCKPRSGKNKKDVLACPSYIAPIIFNNKPYKNIHCAYCNKTFATKQDSFKPILEVAVDKKYQYNDPFGGRMPSKLTPSAVFPGMIPTMDTSGGHAAMEIHRQPTMKVLFDFSFQAGFIFNIDGRPDSRHVLANPCDKKSIYDYLSNSCRTVICPFGREWIDGICKYNEIVNVDDSVLYPTSEMEKGLIVSIVAQAQNYRNISEHLTKSYMHRLNEIIAKYTGDAKNKSDVEIIKYVSGTERTESQFPESGNMTFASQIQFVRGQDVALYEVIQYVAKFRKLISKGNIDKFFKVISVSLSNRDVIEKYICNADRHLNHLKGLAVDIQNNTVYLINGQTNVAYQALTTRFTFSFSPKSSTPDVYDAFICSQLPCPQMKLSDSEYSFSNGTLQLIPTGERLLPEKYEIRNDSVYICIPERNKKSRSPFSKYLYSSLMIQRITYMLSLTALSLTILIYITSASVRTLHGKTLVSLSVSLIGAQLMGLLQNENGGAWCKLVAIVMHFSWLAAFGWMSMISYDMLRTFFGRQTRITDTHAERKRYFMYSITGWLVPGMIVVTCIILDNIDVPEVVKIGYGKDGFCFIAGTRALFIFFSIPFASSVLFNTTAFILTVYGISTKKKANPNSKRSKDRLYSLIYLKLSVVMGVTWLFAILASITDQPVFWYLHLVLNGLQGVFVFTSFALRTSIWKKIKIKKPRFKRKTIRLKDSTFYSISGSPSLHS